MPACDMCARGTPHLREDCTDIFGLDVEEPVIYRVDKYILSVDGKRMVANEDQERRIRALTDEQREAFLHLLGK